MAPPRKPNHTKPTPTPLALRIQHARTNSGHETDASFAKACGFDGRAYWRYTTENVIPSAATLRDIARVGTVDLEWLIGDDPPPVEPATSTKPTLDEDSDLAATVAAVDPERAPLPPTGRLDDPNICDEVSDTRKMKPGHAA